MSNKIPTPTSAICGQSKFKTNMQLRGNPRADLQKHLESCEAVVVKLDADFIKKVRGAIVVVWQQIGSDVDASMEGEKISAVKKNKICVESCIDAQRIESFLDMSVTDTDHAVQYLTAAFSRLDYEKTFNYLCKNIQLY
jgi:hypothetical protein